MIINILHLDKPIAHIELINSQLEINSEDEHVKAVLEQILDSIKRKSRSSSLNEAHLTTVASEIARKTEYKTVVNPE